MQIENIGKRLAELRTKKDVSARDMSLSLGMGAAYINNIENGKSLPSVEGLFYICDYLGITLSEFFDEGSSEPMKLNSIVQDLKKLNASQLDVIRVMIDQMK